MHPLQNLDVASQLARDYEASLVSASVPVWAPGGARPLRRWLGRQLVRTGLWLATDMPMRAAAAR
jgi:hypothetical protein